MRPTSAVIGFTVGAVLVAGCSPAGPEAPHEQTAPIAVTAARATAADLAERLEAGGVVAASESATIAARVLAPVQTVRVRAGDRVRAGEVLLTLDARDVAAQARQAVAAVQAAEQALLQARSEEAAAAADHTLAMAWQGRIAALRVRNSATAQELDEADARLAGAAARAVAGKAGVSQAAALVAARRAASDAAGITESFTVIRAPFAGVVAERLVDPGALATPGAALLRLDADGVRRVEVRVDEARVGYVRPGDRVMVVLDASSGDEVVNGIVAEVARALAADQRAFTVKVSLPPDVTPRTGVFARVRFRGATRRGVVVPSAAVRRQGQVTSVFVAQDGVARIRLVQVGVSDDGSTEVVSGLDAGEVVVVEPPPGLVDGRPLSMTVQGGR
jgi:RND family efflux transporter MFP subunit